MRLLAAGTCVVAFLAMTACDATMEPAVPGVVVMDSAGVRVTMSAPTDVVFAELDSLPVLSLGALDATGPTRFQGIQGMHVDRAGRIWVTHVTSPELRIFESDGSHWKTRGGRGEGPGEFVYAQVVGAAPGDSVLVIDLGLHRLSVFDPAGEFVRTERIPDIDGPGLMPPLHVFGDGSILGQVPRMVRHASLAAGQVVADSFELVRVDVNSSSTRSYGAASGPLSLSMGQTSAPIPFTTRASFDAQGERVHLVSGPEFSVRVIEEGRLREVHGIARPPRSVSELQIEAYRAFVQEYFPDELKADGLAGLDHELRPSLLPAYDRVLLSSGGHTWAQVYDPDLWAPRDWDVFDAEGRFLGQVHVENQFFPMVIDQETVYGIWRDTLGLEQVRAYRFARPS